MREPWLFARVCVPGRLYRVLARRQQPLTVEGD